MAYGIIRAEKVKGVKLGSGLQEHHQRSDKDGIYSNPDIDLNLSKNNIEFIHSDNFRNSIFEKIKEYGITRKIRTDAVIMIDGFCTVSGEFFQSMTQDQIVSYFKGMLPLIEKEYGPIISATLHCDEMKFNQYNYHMHFATVPIVKDDKGNYSLSAKKLMGNQKEYIAKQDRFYNQYFKGYGLDRGVSAKETHAKHINTNRWKAEQTKELNDKLQEKSEDLRDDIEDLNLDQQAIVLKIKQSQKKYQSIVDVCAKYTDRLTEIQNEINADTIICENLKKDITKQEEVIKKNNLLLLSQESTILTNKKMLKQQSQKKQALKDDMDDIAGQVAELRQRMDYLYDEYSGQYDYIDKVDYVSRRLEEEYPDYYMELITDFESYTYISEYGDIER